MSYDYQPNHPMFPMSGLQISPYLFARELRKLGHEVTECNLFETLDYGNVDCIIAAGYWGDLAYLRKTSKPVVFYGTTDGQIPKIFVDKINSLTHFITQSESCKRVALRDGVDSNKISIVYPSPDHTIFKPVVREKTPTKIIFTNFLHGGDKELIKAMPGIVSKCPNICAVLKIHHKVTKEHYEWAKPLIEKLGVNNYVKFMDIQKTHLEMPQFYQHSDLYISLGGIIGFELPFQEANACGCPVVGLNYGAVPEYITDNYNGLMVPVVKTEKYYAAKAGIELTEERPLCNPEDVAAAAGEILTNEDLRNKMIDNGRKLVETKFNCSTQAKIMDEILRKVVQ